MSKMNERAFQNFIKDKIKSEGGFVTQIHPGIGSDSGLPDLMTGLDSIGLLPMELKIGTINDTRTIKCSAIRPSQIRWHTELTSHGYLSSILIGVSTGKTWRIFVVSGIHASNVRHGFIIGNDAKEIDHRYFLSDLDTWASNNSSIFN